MKRDFSRKLNRSQIKRITERKAALASAEAELASLLRPGIIDDPNERVCLHQRRAYQLEYIEFLDEEIAQIAQADATARDDRDPPKLAELLLIACSTARHAEATVGDLNEHFARDCKEKGRDRAVRLYWARTLRSLWPLLRRAIGKALKWGAVIATVKRFL